MKYIISLILYYMSIKFILNTLIALYLQTSIHRYGCHIKSLKSGVYFVLISHLNSDQPHLSCSIPICGKLATITDGTNKTILMKKNILTPAMLNFM